MIGEGIIVVKQTLHLLINSPINTSSTVIPLLALLTPVRRR